MWSGAPLAKYAALPLLLLSLPLLSPVVHAHLVAPYAMKHLTLVCRGSTGDSAHVGRRSGAQGSNRLLSISICMLY